MNPISYVILLVAAFIVVFLESWFGLFRNIFGVQVDLLPALIVYAALTHNIGFVAALAFFGGIFFDSLSSNPLGVTVLPLFFAGMVIYRYRNLLLRQKRYAQFVLGTICSATTPVLVLLTLLSFDKHPIFGLGSIWQLIVMSVVGGLLTPLTFRFFDTIDRTFLYQHVPPSSFNPDRQMKRGRN